MLSSFDLKNIYANYMNMILTSKHGSPTFNAQIGWHVAQINNLNLW